MGLSFGSRSKLWLTVPNPIEAPSATGKGIINPTPLNPSSAGGAPIKPKVEYLATLDKHGATVNVVRFSPSGKLALRARKMQSMLKHEVGSGNILATAGDGTLHICLLGNAGREVLTPTYSQMEPSCCGNSCNWASTTPLSVPLPIKTTHTIEKHGRSSSVLGQYSWPCGINATLKLTWLPCLSARAKEIYDICWSPDGQFILAGGTDNAARIFRVITGEYYAPFWCL
jgi:chromatin assembly factor 1 subunit B